MLHAIVSEPVTLDQHHSMVSPTFLGWKRANTSKYENNFPATENCVCFKMCLNFLVNVTWLVIQIFIYVIRAIR